MKKVTLKNNFHNTETNILVPTEGRLSDGQLKKIKRELCGNADCCCGVIRGPQDAVVEPTHNGRTGREGYQVYWS